MHGLFSNTKGEHIDIINGVDPLIETDDKVIEEFDIFLDRIKEIPESSRLIPKINILCYYITNKPVDGWVEFRYACFEDGLCCDVIYTKHETITDDKKRKEKLYRTKERVVASWNYEASEYNKLTGTKLYYDTYAQIITNIKQISFTGS